MVNRPQVVNYNAISQKLQVAVQKALLGEVDPKQAMTTAAGDVEQILKQ
jgi:ABC-type glycerol-3-phosphate transport system substrate-binding protein